MAQVISDLKKRLPSPRRGLPSLTVARRNAIDHDVDDCLKEGGSNGLASEQQPKVDWPEHRLDHLAGESIGRHLATLDRLLNDDAIQGKTLVPEATIRPGQPAVVWHLRHHGASQLAGVEITMLTTTGAKTGRHRTLPVLGLPDGEDTLLIASNFGRRHNPSWYYNLRANPKATIVLNGIRRDVVARELSGSEREHGYQRGEEIFPGFTQYRRWASHRQIPVIRLEPLS